MFSLLAFIFLLPFYIIMFVLKIVLWCIIIPFTILVGIIFGRK